MFRFYLGLIIKNLFRNKRRTILTTLAIAVGIFYYIMFDSLMTGVDRDSIKSLLELETAYFQVVPQNEDQAKVSLKYLLPDGENLVRQIQRVPGVNGATPRLLFPVSLISGLDELPVVGVGVDPVRESSVFRIKEYVQGNWLRSGENTIVLGKNIADLLQIKLGDQVTIRTQTRLNTFQALDLTVIGLVKSPDPVVNDSQIFIPLDTAQKSLATGNNVSLIAIKTGSYEKMNPVIAKVKQITFGAPIRIKTWREAAASFIATLEMKKAFVWILLLLVGIISVIGVVNSVLLAALERVREIGILKAMGMTESEITKLFTYEAIGIGFIGGLTGVILAVVLNIYLVNVGLDIEKIYGNVNIGLSVGKMYGIWDWPVIIGAFIFGLLISILASILPARKAAKVDPVQSLRRI